MAALQFARIGRSTWDNLVWRGLYPVAPPTTQGIVRTFDTDDLIAAYVLGELLERDVMTSAAAKIACQVRTLIGQDHGIQRLSAWKVTLAKKPRVVVAETAPDDAAIELFVFEIAEIRGRAIDGMREKLRAKAQRT